MWHGAHGAGEAVTDDGFQRALKIRPDDGVESGIVKRSAEGNEFAPLLALGKHAGNEGFAVAQAGIAMEKNVMESVVEPAVMASELGECALRGETVKRIGVGDGLAWTTAAREQRESVGYLGADGINGADVEALGADENFPMQFGGACERSGGEDVGVAIEARGIGVKWKLCGAELGENALAELGSGLVGERDSEDFFRLGNVFTSKQLEEALNEEAGFAGAGWGFHDAGGACIERRGARFSVSDG
jgi:hypothetical protein